MVVVRLSQFSQPQTSHSIVGLKSSGNPNAGCGEDISRPQFTIDMRYAGSVIDCAGSFSRGFQAKKNLPQKTGLGIKIKSESVLGIVGGKRKGRIGQRDCFTGLTKVSIKLT